MGFIGRNGAGKTTVIKCIMDLIPFEAGSIEVLGLDSRKCSDEIRRRVGYVSEEQYFYENMTAGWSLDFFGGFYPNWDRDFGRSLLKRFDIDPSKKVGELSKGMKVKLALALALAHKPELLILDEPTSGLGPVIRNELLELLMEVVLDENCSVFFSSHITTDIEKIADFVTVIEGGRVVISDEKDAIPDGVFNGCSAYVVPLYKFNDVRGREKQYAQIARLSAGQAGDGRQGKVSEHRHPCGRTCGNTCCSSGIYHMHVPGLYHSDVGLHAHRVQAGIYKGRQCQPVRYYRNIHIVWSCFYAGEQPGRMAGSHSGRESPGAPG